jgi:mRNA interferase RelE/StbE
LDDEPETDEERRAVHEAREELARGEVRTLPVATRILDALARLADTGQGEVTRLQGVADEWRLRVGDWRVRFRYGYPTRTLEVLRILLRGQAYR